MAIADLDPEFWQFGMTLFAFGAVSPWLAMTDHAKYGRFVDSVQNLELKTVAGCHTPVLEGDLIEKAFAIVREFPNTEPPPLPDQSVLDQVIAATSAPPG